MAGTRVVGLDIGTTGVRAAQLEFGSGGPSATSQPTLTRVAHVPLPHGAVRDGEVADQDAVGSALRTLWTTGKFDTREVVTGVGNPRIVVRDLELPSMPMAQLRASLKYQVSEMLPMQVSDALLDYYPTGEYDGENGRTVVGMLVAAPLDSVTTNVLAAEGAGLLPTMVDLNSFALVRALARGDLLQRTVAIVDIGARTTNVVIATGGVPRLVRLLRAGGQDTTEAVASTMQLAHAEAEQVKRDLGVGFQAAPGYESAADAVMATTNSLVEAVRNTLSFYTSNHPGSGVDVVVLTGGGAHLPGLGQYLSSVTRLPVSLGDPISSVRVGKTVDRGSLSGYESLLTVAVGLAYGVAA